MFIVSECRKHVLAFATPVWVTTWLDTHSVQEMLEVINLPNLALNRECLPIRRPGLIVVVETFFYRLELVCEQHEAADDQTCSSFTCLAVNCHHWVFQEVLLNASELIWRHQMALEMSWKTVDNIFLLLHHLLYEEEHIHTDVKYLFDRADLMIVKRTFRIPKLWDFVLTVLFATFNTKIINLNINSMSQFHKLNNMFSRVSDCGFNAFCGVAKSYHIVCYICQI